MACVIYRCALSSFTRQQAEVETNRGGRLEKRICGRRHPAQALRRLSFSR